jgi:hypothetical protein
MNTTAMNRVTETATTLRKWLYAAEGLGETITVCEKLALILETTIGLWQAADYTYKGREIALQASNVLMDARLQSRGPGHAKRIAGDDLFIRLRVISNQFHLAEVERLGL